VELKGGTGDEGVRGGDEWATGATGATGEGERGGGGGGKRAIVGRKGVGGSSGREVSVSTSSRSG
jgi:hypothetical protein